jgi:hypothetical protein
MKPIPSWPDTHWRLRAVLLDLALGRRLTVAPVPPVMAAAPWLLQILAGTVETQPPSPLRSLAATKAVEEHFACGDRHGKAA